MIQKDFEGIGKADIEALIADKVKVSKSTIFHYFFT